MAAGQQLFDCAVRAGFGTRSQIHAVGDGAPWIADQVEDQYGAKGRYLLDFFHVCDYLSAAAKAIVPDTEGQKTWMDAQKNRLRTQLSDELLQTLQAHRVESGCRAVAVGSACLFPSLSFDGAQVAWP